MCFCGIIFECIYLLESLHSDHDLNSEKSKQKNISNRALPPRNLGTNPKELHTPTSTPKKPVGNSGDRKMKLKIDRVFYEKKAW